MNDRNPPKGSVVSGQRVMSNRERLAETIYVHKLAHAVAGQFHYAKYAQEAREAAEAFYPEEVPSPSVPMSKAV